MIDTLNFGANGVGGLDAPRRDKALLKGTITALGQSMNIDEVTVTLNPEYTRTKVS